MKKRILVIDDDECVRDSLKKLLAEAGYAVDTAADGPAGVAKLKGEPFDLLVLDLNLPGLSGWDILDHTRTDFPSLPVLILSGELQQCEPGAFAGAEAVLEKPPDVGHLLRTVEKLLTEPAGERLRRVCPEPDGALTTAPGVLSYLRRQRKFPGGPLV